MTYNDESQEEFAQRQGGTDALARAAGIPAEDVDAALRRIEAGLSASAPWHVPIWNLIREERERLGLPREIKV